MSRGSIHVRGVFESREMCWKCRRPMRVCYCAAVKPVETRTRIVILQHPRESDVPINTARIAELMQRSLMLVTALAPKIGYDNAAKVAKSAHARGTTLKEEAVRLGLVSVAEFERLVQPVKMPHPG